MKAIKTTIPDLLIFEPKVFGDDRGFFFESFNQHKFAELTGREVNFVQDNHSRSTKNVLRGLHYQIQHPQGKLMRVVQGAVYDIAVDIRKNSPTFGQYAGFELTAENKHIFWIPEGFAHGFVVLSDSADVIYKTTDYWFPEYERCIRWDDSTLAIDWKIQTAPNLSVKDRQGKNFADAELFI